MAFCCLSNRMGSLIFLYLFMVFCAMTLLFLIVYGRPLPLLVMFTYDPRDPLWVIIALLITSLIGVVIFFRTIVYMFYNTPSVFSLWKSIVFSMLIIFCDVCGVFYRPDLRNTWFKSEFDMLQFTIVKVLILFYAITVFHSYIVELQKSQKTVDDVPVYYNVQDKVAHVSPPACYYLPQNSAQPPSYPVKTPQYFEESNKY